MIPLSLFLGVVKKLVGVPLTKIENLLEDMQCFIHLHNFSLKPYLPRIYTKKSQLTWSKAFFISNLQRMPVTLSLILLSKHMLAMLSSIHLPLTNAFWDFVMIFSMTTLKWLANSFEMILYTPLTRLGSKILHLHGQLF